MKITKKGKSASQTRICPSFWPVWCRLVSSKSCKKVVVVSPFYFILCRPLPSGTTYCVLLVQWLHCGEQFTVCSILPYHALLSHISHEIQNFFIHFAFILFYLVIVKWGKIWGNALKPQIGFVVCVHLIYYTHQYHPCQIETISKKKRGTFLYPSSFIQGTHRFPHGLGIPA